MSEQLSEKIARDVLGKFDTSSWNLQKGYDDIDWRDLCAEIEPELIALIQRHLSESQEWQPIESAPEYKTILTIHQDDLYPVSAFNFWQDGKQYWMRIIEGPEDIIRPEQGDHKELLRPPTHWMPLPLPPSPTQPVAADARRDCRGNETGYHTCGLPIGGCGKNAPAVTEDAPCPDDVCGDAFTHAMPVAHVHNKILADAAVAQPEAEAQPPQRFPDVDSLLEVVGDIGAELDAEGLNLETADRIYERGRQDGLREAASSTPVDAEPLCIFCKARPIMPDRAACELCYQERMDRVAFLASDPDIAEAQRLYELTPEGKWDFMMDRSGRYEIRSLEVPGLITATLEYWEYAENTASNIAAWIAAAHNLWPALMRRLNRS